MSKLEGKKKHGRRERTREGREQLSSKREGGKVSSSTTEMQREAVEREEGAGKKKKEEYLCVITHASPQTYHFICISDRDNDRAKL